MKHTPFLMAALAALSLASASATTTYVTGSTAFEAQADKAFTNFISATGGSVQASDNASLGSEANIVFVYGTPATNYIIAHWSGSEAGVQAIDSPATNTTYVTNFFSTSVTGGQGGASASLATNSAAAQIAFSDTFYQSSQFRPGKHAGDGKTYGTPSKDYIVALQGFAFYGSTNFPVTNITSQQIRNVYAAGFESLAFVTGKAADETNTIWSVGRNPDSGTRIQAQSESGIGATAAVNQGQVVGGNTLVQYPAGTVDGISYAAGNNGYSSTGTLLAALTNPTVVGGNWDASAQYYSGGADGSGSNFVVGYAAASKIGTVGTVALSYNGVAASTANITNGLYTFWGYEHILVSPSYSDATASNVANGIQGFLTNATSSFLGSGNASVTDGVNVTRSTDGGVVTQNY